MPGYDSFGGAGATWIWPPAGCGSRPTSGGSTVASAHGSEPKTCRGLGRSEAVGDLEDVIAWLAQRTDKTSICRLLRVSWETVHEVVMRVVDEHLDDDRLNGLFNLGYDEISYKRGHQYLTVIADRHRQGRLGRQRAQSGCVDQLL